MFKKSLILSGFLWMSSAAFAMPLQEKEASPHVKSTYVVCQSVREERDHLGLQKVAAFCQKNGIKLKKDRSSALLYCSFCVEEEDLGLHKQILNEIPGQTPILTYYVSFPSDVKVSELSYESPVLFAKIAIKDPMKDPVLFAELKINAYYGVNNPSLAQSLSKLEPPVILIGVADGTCPSDRIAEEGEFTLPLNKILSIGKLDPEIVSYLLPVELEKSQPGKQEESSKKRSLSPVELGPSKHLNI